MKLTTVALLAASALSAQTVADVERGFAHPPDDARIMMRWWWFGPAATKPELEREMRAMKAGGIGGFEVQPVYPLEVEGNYPYLSDRFLEMVRFAGEKAKELGLRFDMTLCSGWPYGGPHIGVADASARLRVSKTEPKLAEGERIVATPTLADGSKVWMVESRTRQMVKRAAVGAEGFVLDHYSEAALDKHLRVVGEKLLDAAGPNRPYAVFSDSLEVYGADWTPNFLAEFQKRRGYDLMPYIGALAGDIGDKTMAVRHDWGKTLSELADDNYLKPLRAWAQKHGTRLRSQTYGIPPVTLSSNALVDLPEGEGAQWRSASSTRWASSASHLYGRNVTSSETWTWLHSPVFRATPLDMKAEADLHFLEGINQLVGHGWPYSPPEAGEPGWRFYAAAVFNDHNPWHIAMPDIARYMQRVSWLLRQGTPVNDVAIYLPTDDAFAAFTLGRPSVNQLMDRLIGPNVIPQILDAGYNFDFIDDAAIAKVGVPYKILVVPGVERMPLATLEKITKAGVTVIATRRTPSLAPGLEDAGDAAKIRELARGLKVVTDESKLGDALKAALPPDVVRAPEIGFVHRKLADGDLYFLANTSNHPALAGARFRAAGASARFLNPVTGEYRDRPAGAEFAPYESRIVIFSRSAASMPGPRATGASTPIDLSSGWKVAFPDGAVEMDKLRSWTDDRTFYSGTATYEKTVAVRDVPPQGLKLTFGNGTPVESAGRRSGNGMRAMLDSPVREAAIVYVNGKRAGAVWCAPFEIDVTPYVKTGENAIRIVVANSAMNVLAKGPLPDYKALNAKYGERFQPQDMQAVAPQPSGLLGPVHLVSR